MTGVPQGDAPYLLNTSYTITADLTVPEGGAEGMIVTSGGRFAGWGFYLLEGKPVFNWNLLNLEWVKWQAPEALAPGRHTVEFDVITSYSIHYTKLYELSLPEHTRPSRCPTARGGSVPGLLLAALLGCLLAGCKIVVTVPEGGRVVTEDGFVCEAGQTCEIEVSDTSFDSTFTAEAKPGYTFTRWRPKARAFCGNQSSPCHLSTAPLGGDQGFLDLLASDEEFYLEPILVNYDVSWSYNFV